ncbi:hypothetical protein ABIA99_003492 [Bradyrhizobium sp. LB12.1]|uniref:hypothetical protein n=1 Tax=Bradyrhizobium sp. LB12.1 TaxID=3156327 RepID=UPI00339776D7
MTLEQYLTPDPSLRPPRPCPDFLPDPLPSLSSRTIGMHSAISVHGWDYIDGRKVFYEAELERLFAILAKMRPDVLAVAEQPPAIFFIDDQGLKRPHTFDFLLTTTAGRELVAVKPAHLVEKTGVGRIVELVAEQIMPSVADYVVLFTDKELSDVDVRNAELLHGASRDPWPEDDAVVAKIVRKLKGEITVGELILASKLGGYAFDAVMRAISAGAVELVEYGAINDHTRLRLSGKKA